MKIKFLVISLAITTLVACASRPAVRAEYTALPTLDKGFGRIYVSAGEMSGIDLWSDHQVGPVFINNKNVGSTAEDEHIAVDMKPGTYEAYCTQNQPEKNFIEKREITVQAGKAKSYACDMDSHGAGGLFGALGALASEYLTKSFLTERPIDPDSKLVSYRKIQ